MKIRCDECNWRGQASEVLTAPNPFDESEDIEGCPNCKTIGELFVVCDEPDCWRNATCGTPTKNGYRQTCGKHQPKEGA